MPKPSSGWSRPDHREPVGHREPGGQQRDKAEEDGLALGGGVIGELLSWCSKQEPRPRRSGSFCMLDIRKGRVGEILRTDWGKNKSTKNKRNCAILGWDHIGRLFE